MPLTTEGVIEELLRFREDKLALVGLVGSMGQEGPEDALERLREVRSVASEQLTRIRRIPKTQLSGVERRMRPMWEGMYELTNEIEPWLSQICEKTTT